MGSNGPSQNVVSTMYTLHMHIDHVKTGSAKIFAPLPSSPPPPPLSLWNTPEALLKLASFVYVNFVILQCPHSLRNNKPITFLTISNVWIVIILCASYHTCDSSQGPTTLKRTCCAYLQICFLATWQQRGVVTTIQNTMSDITPSNISQPGLSSDK